MKILLIQPDTSQKLVGFTSMVRPEPLALEIVAANVPEHDVKILDLRIDPTLDSTLASFRPDLVGITGYTINVPRMKEICRLTKEFNPRISTIVGGYHASLCPQDFDHDFIDIIAVGEGEMTFRELVAALEGQHDLATVDGLIYREEGHQVRTNPRRLVHNLSELPLPARHLTDQYREHYHFHFWDNPYLVETARGCPYRCTFCAVWKFHRGKCRYREPANVFEDLRNIASRIVCFVDDNFLQSFRRVERLHELIKSAGIQAQYWIQARADSIVRRPDIIKKWADIGLSSALVGFEAIRDEDLANLNKQSSVKTNEQAMKILNDNGVGMWGMFMVNPQWTRRDFDALIDYVRSMKISFPTFTILTPLPGTTFFQEKVSELTTSNYELFDFFHAVLPIKLPLEEFYANMARLYASTTLGLAELKRRIRSGQIPSSSLGRLRDLLKDVTNPKAYLQSATTPELAG